MSSSGQRLQDEQVCDAEHSGQVAAMLRALAALATYFARDRTGAGLAVEELSRRMGKPRMGVGMT